MLLVISDVVFQVFFFIMDSLASSNSLLLGKTRTGTIPILILHFSIFFVAPRRLLIDIPALSFHRAKRVMPLYPASFVHVFLTGLQYSLSIYSSCWQLSHQVLFQSRNKAFKNGTHLHFISIFEKSFSISSGLQCQAGLRENRRSVFTFILLNRGKATRRSVKENSVKTVFSN